MDNSASNIQSSCVQCTIYIILLQVELGVKGYSPLHLLPYFDIIRCIPVDYMHCVLLGVVKQLSSLWFNSNNHKYEW